MPSKIALCALGVLLIGSTVFFKERMFFIDTAYYSFNILNYNRLALVHNRYGAFISQIIPYAAMKMHLPVRVVLMGYSINIYLFFLLVGALLVYRYRQYRLAIVMGLFYFLIAGNSYFLACAEIFEAVAWMFLFYAVTIYLGEKRVNFFLLSIPFIVLGFLTISTHFQVIIPMLFLWVYFIVEGINWPFSTRETVYLSCLLAATFLAKLLLIKPDAYDSSHLQGVQHFSFHDIIGTFSTPVIRMFLHRCVYNYWLVILVLIVGIVSLLKNNQKILAAWTAISFMGYLVVMGLIYRDIDWDPSLLHLDYEWACLGIIAATPFVSSFLPGQKAAFATWILILVFIIRMGYFFTAVPPFSRRVQFENKVLDQMKKKRIPKLALYQDSTLRSGTILDWAVTYESLLMSSANSDNPQLTFFIVKRNDYPMLEAIKNPKVYYNSFDVMPSDRLNPEYFAIDTTQPYQVMTYEELFK